MPPLFFFFISHSYWTFNVDGCELKGIFKYFSYSSYPFPLKFPKEVKSTNLDQASHARLNPLTTLSEEDDNTKQRRPRKIVNITWWVQFIQKGKKIQIQFMLGFKKQTKSLRTNSWWAHQGNEFDEEIVMQHVSTFPSSCQCHVLFFPLLTLSSRVQCFHGLLIILYIFVQFPSQYANAW